MEFKAYIAPSTIPMIGKTIERIRARIPRGSFLTVAMIPNTSAAGPKRIGKNKTETAAKIIANVDNLFDCTWCLSFEVTHQHIVSMQKHG